jgi:hypothetical protein
LAIVGAAFVLLIGLTVLITGQPASKLSRRPASPHFVGVPDDWTHHHVVFSNPGTYEQVAKDPAAYAKWLTIRYDTRFILQQMKQNPAQQAPATVPGFATLAGRLGAPTSDRWPIRRPPPRFLLGEPLKQDWSMSLGSTGTVGAGQFPAKFSFSTSSASCSDLVVFNTGLAGVSAGQANIVAYSNPYSSPTCTGTVPSVYWAYYSGGGKALTSPVISLDGSKVAFVENPATGTGAAILRIIAWQSGQGTAAGAATPTESYTNTTVGAAGNKAWNTTNCPTGDSCMISVAFQSPDGNPDARSAPFYVYEGPDTIYVGDASGYLHEFTGVFLGTPAEVTSGGWPIHVSGNILTSPVYDSGTSGNIFVADSGGYLYSYKPSSAAHEMTSSKLALTGSTGIVDGPLVDSTTEEVYVFVGNDENTNTSCSYDCNTSTGCNGVFQFPAGNTTIGTGVCASSSATSWGSATNCGKESVFGVGNTTTTLYDGAFDHIYFVGSGTSGYLWTCAATGTPAPKLDYTNMSAFVPSGNVIGNATDAIKPLTSTGATCSPVTEIWGTGGGTNDYIFLSVSGNGNISDGSTCTGACVYNFLVATGGTATTGGTESTPSAATAGLAAASGSSGIIIDNTSSSTGASEIYFSSLANGASACAGNGTTGNTIGGCAVQAKQSAP